MQSTAIRDRLRSRLPDSPMAAGVEVWRDLNQLPAEPEEVEFWVPPPFVRDPDAAAAAVAKLTNLRVVQTQSAGVDGVLRWLPEHVLLCDARGVHGSSTSEWALTAILAVLREFPRFERARQQRRWEDAVTDELAGKRVLIVGAGDVGQQLARRLAACDAEPVFAARTARDGVHGVDELPELLPRRRRGGAAGSADQRDARHGRMPRSWAGCPTVRCWSTPPAAGRATPARCWPSCSPAGCGPRST